jgi:hypothetical protein
MKTPRSESKAFTAAGRSRALVARLPQRSLNANPTKVHLSGRDAEHFQRNLDVTAVLFQAGELGLSTWTGIWRR